MKQKTSWMLASCLMASAVLATASPARADDEDVSQTEAAPAASVMGRNLYVGGNLGFSAASNNVGTGLGFRLNAGWFFVGNFGLGAFLRAANHSGTPAPSTSSYGGELLYRLDELLPGLHAGVQGGVTRLSTTRNMEASGPMAGLKVAYDWAFSSAYPLTVGGEVTTGYAWIGETKLGMTSPMVTAKLWF